MFDVHFRQCCRYPVWYLSQIPEMFWPRGPDYVTVYNEHDIDLPVPRASVRLVNLIITANHIKFNRP